MSSNLFCMISSNFIKTQIDEARNFEKKEVVMLIKDPPTSHPALSAKIRGQILPKFRQIPPDSAKSRIFCQIPHCRVFPTGSMGMQDLVMMRGCSVNINEFINFQANSSYWYHPTTRVILWSPQVTPRHT